MIYWKCLYCDTNNLYPNSLECECCGEKITPNQIEEARRFYFYKERADEGDSYAMMNMAEFYAAGNIFVQDIDQALELMTKAANMGNSDAQQKLADWYFYENNDFPVNDELAFKWATKAYDGGNLYSSQFLSSFYLYGHIVPKDIKKGIKLLEESANLGLIGSIEKIANFYNDGEYVEVDKAKAAKYYLRLSVEDGCLMETAYNAGFVYFSGEYVEKNYAMALKWFKYAVEQYGDLGSKIMIAKFYHDGLGVTQNKSLGHKMMIEIANNKTDKWSATMANKYLSVWANEN